MRISDWSSDVCSSDLPHQIGCARLTAHACNERAIDLHARQRQFGEMTDRGKTGTEIVHRQRYPGARQVMQLRNDLRARVEQGILGDLADRKSTRLNSSH